MVASILAMAVVYAGLPAARLEALSEARDKFEEDVRETGETIYSMGPGEQKVLGFWPVGRSEWRFLYYTIPDSEDDLIFQQREGNTVVTKWEVPLEKAKGTSLYSGTMAKYLKTLGLQVSGQVTDEQAKWLDDVHALAGYGSLGSEYAQPTAWIVFPDGTTSLSQVYDEYGVGVRKHDEYQYWPPITAMESKAMGLGSENWPLIWKFKTEKLRLAWR